jgi:hypothetical protein
MRYRSVLFRVPVREEAEEARSDETTNDEGLAAVSDWLRRASETEALFRALHDAAEPKTGPRAAEFAQAS